MVCGPEKGEPMAEERVSRRRMLKRIGAGAAVAWTAPVITTLSAGPAFAQSAACDCRSDPCLNPCGPPDGGCLCAEHVGGGCDCFIPQCLSPCSQDSDCGPGALCVLTCCGENTCANLCGGGSSGRRGGKARGWSKA